MSVPCESIVDDKFYVPSIAHKARALERVAIVYILVNEKYRTKCTNSIVHIDLYTTTMYVHLYMSRLEACSLSMAWCMHYTV